MATCFFPHTYTVLVSIFFALSESKHGEEEAGGGGGETYQSNQNRLNPFLPRSPFFTLSKKDGQLPQAQPLVDELDPVNTSLIDGFEHSEGETEVFVLTVPIKKRSRGQSPP